MIYEEEFTFFGGEVGGFELNGGWVIHDFLVECGSGWGVVGRSRVGMMEQLVGEFVKVKCRGSSVDLVLFEDAFFDEVFVGAVDHALGEKSAW